MIRFAYLFMLFVLVGTGGYAAEKAAKDDVKDGDQGRVFSGRVVRVLDGDTVILDGDRRVRLLDINTPELAHDGRAAEPYGREAAAYLKALVEGQHVTVQTGAKEKDKFDRLLGQVYLDNGGWVNGTLVRDGYAHVYTFADNAMYGPQLLAYEKQARAARKGLWVLDRWTVRKAGDCCGRADIGTFKLVQGRVLAAVNVKDKGRERVYLNFGPDWRTDFSVFVEKKDMKWFKKAGIKDIAAFYRGHEVLVHGYLQPVNGVLVRVTHPAQIELLD
jgi:endonuclease YncB( thermonuclease family)